MDRGGARAAPRARPLRGGLPARAAHRAPGGARDGRQRRRAGAAAARHRLPAHHLPGPGAGTGAADLRGRAGVRPLPGALGMTPRVVASIALLVIGVGIELACCVGVLVMRGVYDKLHYTAPATTLGALAVMGAVLLRESIVQYGLKAILITVVLLITNPVLTHAI